MVGMSVNHKLATIERAWGPTLDVLSEYGFHDHCLEGAALLMAVLHKLGLTDAYRLTVRVTVSNAAHVRFIKEHGVPSDDATANAYNDAGGAQVQLGYEEAGPDRWAGHLCVIVPNGFGEKHALLDATISQVSQPEWGIQVPPLCLKAADDFVLGQRIAPFQIGEAVLAYEAFPDDKSYNQWGDRLHSPGFEDAVHEVLQRIAH
jgi:hypothetical protein